MATFNPPTHLARPGHNDNDFSVERAANRLGRHFGPYPVGRTIIKVNGVFTQFDTPQSSQFDGLVDGVDYFRGGYTYTVSGDLADDLEAAGFGTVSSNPYRGGYGDPY